jgi:hypothetical protein
VFGDESALVVDLLLESDFFNDDGSSRCGVELCVVAFKVRQIGPTA